MFDSVDLDDKRSAGRVLVLPNAPWGVKPPTDPNHYVAPETPPSDQQVADRQRARSIADQMLATVPPELQQAAYDAYQASQQGGRALNAVQREYATLQAPAPAGMGIDDLGARNVRRVALVTYIEDLKRQQEAANQALAAIVDDLHFQTEHYTGRAILDQERRTIREMRDEAQRLLEQADHRQIALSNAISAINVWMPTTAPAPTPIAPVQSAPVVEPAKPTRHRLFERKN